jgi:hypothetical protein
LVVLEASADTTAPSKNATPLGSPLTFWGHVEMAACHSMSS